MDEMAESERDAAPLKRRFFVRRRGMPQRLNTIIIVPHSKAKFFKFSFSTRTLMVAGLCCGIALMLSILAISYTGSAVNQRAEVHRLRTENQQLADVNRRLAQTISDVQGRLDEFEERTSRLALAAGMETEAVGLADRSEAGSPVGSGGPYDRLPGSPETLEIQGDWISTQLEMVENRIAQQDLTFTSTPTTAPVLGLLTDGYGRRRDPFTGRRAFHRGLDISARRGTSVLAPADGIVVFAGRNGGLGKIVRVSHGFGYTTLYGHLDKISVSVGDELRRGEEVGLLGNSGRSTGPHLHYEVHMDGRAVDPLYYILNAY
jgi:murein DD-endopeptidase MepM/ murein hydrolase activator NlpD